MRLPLLVLVATAVLAPSAAALPATLFPAHVDLALERPEVAVPLNGTHVVPARLEYCYSTLGARVQENVEVRIRIAGAPEWLRVIPVPDRVDVPLDANGAERCIPPVELAFILAPRAPHAGAEGNVTVEVQTDGSPFYQSSRDVETLHVRAGGVAPESGSLPPRLHRGLAADNASPLDLAVQDAGDADAAESVADADPFVIALLGFAGAGAGFGYALWRNRPA